VLGEVWVLEEHDVIVGTGGGHRVPHTSQSLLLIICVEDDLKDPRFVRRPDVHTGQGCGKLIKSPVISRRVGMQQQHADDVSGGHVCDPIDHWLHVRILR
jgi:hypothetical protein